MADKISSAVIQETVSQILSGVVRKYEENEESSSRRNVERLEMAHIRLQAALDVSDKWQITDESMLRWRRKLKRACQECNDTLQKWKQRVLEDEQMKQEVRNLPFPKRMAHATKSFVFSSCRNSMSYSTSVVRRFEWFADGASEFLRFIELGGTPRHLMPFDSLIRHLFEGKKLQQKIIKGNECPLYLLWLPYSSTEYGIEASLSFIQKDSYAPEDNFYFSVMLQISESTDIIGIIVKCLQLFPPHLKSISETIRRKVTQLPTLDFSWVPFADSYQRDHWCNLHSFCTQWFRPDPFCCKKHGQHKFHRASNNLDMTGSPDVSLEPVTHVTFLCQISCSKYSRKRTFLSEPKSSMLESQYLQLGLVYMPHGSSEDAVLADKSSAVAEIRGKEKHLLHTDITLEEVNETILLKANDYFRHNSEETIHQLVWRSRHGAAYMEARKANIEKPSARIISQRYRKTELVQLRDQDMGMRVHMILQFLNSWGAQAPTRLRKLIMKWIQKELEIQLQYQHRT